MFERLRAAVNAALDAAMSASDPREVASQMREAVLDARTAIEKMRDDLTATERELASERRHLSDAERRGRLAAGIQDTETVEVAQRFAVKHRERLAVLERKVEAQRSELALAERELEDMKQQLREAQRAGPATEASRRVEAAWRELEAAGGVRPDTDVRDDTLRSQIDRSAREALAEEQLRALKEKLRKR